MSDAAQTSTRLVALTRELLAVAQEQRDILRHGTLQQLDWLTPRIEELMNDVKLASEAEPPSTQDMPTLRQLAAEFEAVRAESEAAIDTINHTQTHDKEGTA